MQFRKGDIVQVKYVSPEKIEQWMQGFALVGPDDVGVVAYDTANVSVVSGLITVDFPMVGRVGIMSYDLKKIGRVGESENNS